jgi:undecaprenyl-diphosphatase
MNKSKYVIAMCTFVVFCIIWMTYETSFIQSFDRIASDSLYGNKFITLFHYLGETKFIFAVTIIVLIITWLREHEYRLMVFIILSVGAGYGLYQFLKRVIERPRPEIVDQFSTFSFPSGHAVHGFLYLLTIAYLINQTVIISKRASIIVWISAILLAFLIGLSRITEGRHFASDVLAGWMLGYSWFILCLWWYKRGNNELSK